MKAIIRKEIRDIKKQALQEIQSRVEWAEEQINEVVKYFMEDLPNVKLPNNVEEVVAHGGIVAVDEFEADERDYIEVRTKWGRLFDKYGNFAHRQLQDLPKGKYKVTLIVEKLGE